MTPFDARVQQGARLLDRLYPDWWGHVDDSVLDMASPLSCVLGQIGRTIGVSMGCHDRSGLLDSTGPDRVVGGATPYSVMLAQIFDEALPSRGGTVMESSPVIDHGFSLTADDLAVPRAWSALERAWWAAIEARKELAR